jgi:hypothetical protein
LKQRQRRQKKAEIFDRMNPVSGGTFQADLVLASWATIQPPGSSILVENLEVSWTQQVTRIYEIGGEGGDTRWMRCTWTGPASGAWQAGRVLAPGQIIMLFSRTYTPPQDSAPTLSCQTEGGSTPRSPTPPGHWLMDGVEVASVGFQLAAQSLSIQ